MSLHLPEAPVAFSGLNALLTTAADHGGDQILVEDDEAAITAAGVERRVDRLAIQLRSSGLRRGERVLIVGTAQAATLLAMIAVLRVGLEPVMVPADAAAVELAAAADVADAVALIGPSRHGGNDCGELYLSTAALAERIRGVMVHGPDPVDGAVDISFDALDALPEAAGTAEGSVLEMPTISTLTGSRSAPRLASHRQAALFADAFSLVEQAQINPSRRVVSLLPPCTLAGLVAGPFAALAGASRLVLHGPFSAARFLAHGDAIHDGGESFHLVAPASAGSFFASPDLGFDLASMVLVSRFEDEDAFVPPQKVTAATPIVDLYTFGERAVLAQRREGGEAAPPVRGADLSLTDGLGARLNRARAEQRIQAADGLS